MLSQIYLSIQGLLYFIYIKIKTDIKEEKTRMKTYKGHYKKKKQKY